MKRTSLLFLLLLSAGVLAFSGPGSANSPVPDSGQAAARNDSDAVQLDVQWDPGDGTRGGYVLRINGNAMPWGQDIGSAVSFCAANGIPMETMEDGAGHSGIRNIVFARNIPLSDEYAFYVDHGGGGAESRLSQIRMYMAIDAGTPEEAGKLAQEVYDKLEASLGKPTDKLSVYTGSGFVDAVGSDMAGAVKQMADHVEGDYGFAGAHFDNLSLYVLYREGSLSVFLSLTIF